jgi:hypothetical protein
VTGTLKTLTDSERKIIHDIYSIRNFSYMPSVYGDSKFIYVPGSDILIAEGKEAYFDAIINDMKDHLKTTKGIRSVIIFFDNIAKLLEFLNYDKFGTYKDDVHIIEESMNAEEKLTNIKTASYEA